MNIKKIKEVQSNKFLGKCPIVCQKLASFNSMIIYHPNKML